MVHRWEREKAEHAKRLDQMIRRVQQERSLRAEQRRQLELAQLRFDEEEKAA